MREAETPVEFQPPDNLRPGELGTLIDFEANPLDVTATIIDLAVRGYLKIEELDKEWYQRKHDWLLTKLPKEGELRRYERTLYDGLFADGTPRPMIVIAVLGGFLTMVTGAVPMLQKRFGTVPPAG